MVGRDVPMSLRRTVVEVSTDGLNVSAFCAEHGISTWFFYDLRRRFRRDGPSALEPKRRVPGVVRNKTGVEVEDAVIALRKELVDAGLDAGPATIAFHLGARGSVSPSESTIWRILSRRGFVVPDPKKRPTTSARSFTAERANECWQIDDTTWPLADGSEVKILNVVDDHSRVLIASIAVASCTATAAFDAMATGASQWGWPARFLSDNAKAFRHGLADAMRALGVAPGHARPYHPQTCGKVERFHDTLKKRLTALDRARTLVELQAQLDEFRDLYNHRRPHKSLAKRFPADVWAGAPKDAPSNRRLDAPTRVSRSTVENGRAAAGHHYRITIGAAYNNLTATAVITGTTCHVFVDGRLVRRLELDPTRRLQPLYDRPGHPPTVREAPRHP